MKIYHYIHGKFDRKYWGWSYRFCLSLVKPLIWHRFIITSGDVNCLPTVSDGETWHCWLCLCILLTLQLSNCIPKTLCGLRKAVKEVQNKIIKYPHHFPKSPFILEIKIQVDSPEERNTLQNILINKFFTQKTLIIFIFTLFSKCANISLCTTQYSNKYSQNCNSSNMIRY